MNPCFRDWNIEAEIPVPTLKNKSTGLDRELVELLWEDGQVVLHSQTHQHHHQQQQQPKPWLLQHQIESRQTNKHNHDQSITRGSGGGGSCENPAPGLIQDTETVSWIDCHVDDPFERDFPSNFLSEFPLSNPVEGLEEPDKCIRKFEDYKSSNIAASSEVNHRVLLPYDTSYASFSSNLLLPPRFHAFDSAQQRDSHSGRGISKIADIPLSAKADFRTSNKGGSNWTAGGGEVKEYSVKTVGSSHCGSNQVVNDHAEASRVSSCGIGDRGLSAAVAKDHVGKMSSQSDRLQTETMETAITSSSSGGSGTSFGRTCNQSTGTKSHKRKSRGLAEDSECQSRDAELESAARKKLSLKSGSSLKSRAAEVHNLSERRRRDRINEKMRALQELLPRCNKTDKASMLDEAIEYMKSLQLQLQIMWMGSGMAPMMFPGVQHYLSRLGMGIGPLAMPSVHNPMHLSRLPLFDQATIPNRAALFQTTMLNSTNYHNQLANSNFSNQYANYAAFHPLQSASQHMNIFSFGANTAQHNHMLAPSSNCNGPSSG